MKTGEANLDGLVGPTHHYGGLAQGNVASQVNALTLSNPRKAALQGLDKMKLLHELGIVQFILPPPVRPNPAFYDPLIKDIAELSVLFSASYMWRANAATVTPSTDSGGKMRVTPANLLSHRHRAQECPETTALLKTLFSDPGCFGHYPPLPVEQQFADEGAANHMRLAASHGSSGVHVFVYGKDMDNPDANQPLHFKPRATKQGAELIAGHHGLDPALTVFVQQNPEAVDRGVFHNDVIAMSNEYVLISHEKAWVGQAAFLSHCKSLLPELMAIEVKDREVSLGDAVATYLFNSQLITLPGGSMVLIAPSECEERKETRRWIDALIADDRNPVNQVIYCNLRESMKNGGGPACLRLRAVMNEAECAAADRRYRYSPSLHARLSAVIERHYRDRLELRDLEDPDFAQEARAAQQKIMEQFV